MRLAYLALATVALSYAAYYSYMNLGREYGLVLVALAMLAAWRTSERAKEAWYGL